MQGSLLDDQELLESLNQAKAKAATINASLQESRNVQVCSNKFIVYGTWLRPTGALIAPWCRLCLLNIQA